MTKRLRIAGGVCAVWDDASDDDPFTDPENNLARVKFHSELNYLKVIDEQTHTVNFSSKGAGVFTGSYTMFAHGLAGIPLVFASTTVDGETVAFTGSIPVQVSSLFPPFGTRWPRWVTVGADATNVYAFEYGRLPTGYSMSAASFDITTWVTDRLYS